MKHKRVRIAIGVLAAFIALLAIGGGIVMLAGTYQDGVLIEAGGRGQFPLEWLHNTPSLLANQAYMRRKKGHVHG